MCVSVSQCLSALVSVSVFVSVSVSVSMSVFVAWQGDGLYECKYWSVCVYVLIKSHMRMSDVTHVDESCHTCA